MKSQTCILKEFETFHFIRAAVDVWNKTKELNSELHCRIYYCLFKKKMKRIKDNLNYYASIGNIREMYTSLNNNWDSLFKGILWYLLVNFQNWNIWKVFFFSPITNKKDRRANLWIKRFNAPCFFACARVKLNGNQSDMALVGLKGVNVTEMQLIHY